MLNRKCLILITFLFLLSILGRVYGDQNRVIKWKQVHGAGGYIVEIIDSDDKTVIKRETKSNSLDVSGLPLGIYKYRIITLNKLKEVGKDTGWLTLTVKKEDIIQAVDVALGVGWEYNIPLSPMSDKLHNSYKGLNIYLSFPLSVISPVRKFSFISSLCVEAQSSFLQYPLVKENMDPSCSDQSYSIYGFHAGLNYPISLDAINPKIKLIFNLDPGLSYSKYSGKFYDSIHSRNESFERTSMDFSLITGATARYFWTNYFFTDVSTQYYRIFYLANPLNDIKLILRIGMLF